ASNGGGRCVVSAGARFPRPRPLPAVVSPPWANDDAGIASAATPSARSSSRREIRPLSNSLNNRSIGLSIVVSWLEPSGSARGRRFCHANERPGHRTATRRRPPGLPVYRSTGLPVYLLSGSRNAMNSPEYGPPLTATTMYCFPFTANVIGDALIGAGRSTAPTSAPVALS